MKKFICIFVFIISIVLSSCANSQEIALDTANSMEISAVDTELNINEYFPFLENTTLEYVGIGNEYAGGTRFFEFIDGEKAQLKEKNSGTNFIRVIEIKNATLTELYSEGEFYHIENALNNKPNSQEIILKEPLVVGNRWFTSNGYNREITSIDSEIETPFGVFKTIEVTTEFDNGRFEKRYYSSGIGFVASVYKDGEMEVKTLLEDIKYGPMNGEIITYYPLYRGGGSVYLNDTLDFETNSNIEKVIADKLKFPPNKELVASIPAGTTVNRIYLDKSTWIAHVDFSKELLTDLNAGSSYEFEILRSIVNTIGKFYDTDKVYITVEGKPYESGHFALQEGEAFKTNFDNIEEYK